MTTDADTMRAAALLLRSLGWTLSPDATAELGLMLADWLEDGASDLDANLGFVETSQMETAVTVALLILREKP